MYINSLVCVGVKGGESKQFRINSSVRPWCIMSSWLFNVHINTMIKEVKMRMGRGARFQ